MHVKVLTDSTRKVAHKFCNFVDVHHNVVIRCCRIFAELRRIIFKAESFTRSENKNK